MLKLFKNLSIFFWFLGYVLQSVIGKTIVEVLLLYLFNYLCINFYDYSLITHWLVVVPSGVSVDP